MLPTGSSVIEQIGASTSPAGATLSKRGIAAPCAKPLDIAVSTSAMIKTRVAPIVLPTRIDFASSILRSGLAAQSYSQHTRVSSTHVRYPDIDWETQHHLAY